nr:PREDICTED: beta-1,4-glucuronyltransferase 1-like [Bemisia tabaci]
MMKFSVGKLIIFLALVIVVLQIIHLILLNKLDNRNRLKSLLMAPQQVDIDAIDEEVEVTFLQLADQLQKGSILDSSGEYQIVFNLAPALKKPKPSDVTIVTQCSYDHLKNLINLIVFWQGPISVAVYAENENLPEALWSIANLLACHSLIKTFVTFHLVSPLPPKISPPVSIAPSLLSKQPCQWINTSESNYAKRRSYPNNLLRNVGRKNIASDFILIIDIDILPSHNLRKDFIKFATSKKVSQKYPNEFNKTVFVLPAFEVNSEISTPLHKDQLTHLLKLGVARPFYMEVCSKCHIPTNYEAWQKEISSSELLPLFEVPWKDPWEPFYIALKNIPSYDERFKQYGFNRISQVCELHIAGYTFAVLNNAFLVHQGWKTASTFHSAKENDLERNRILFRQFKQELKSKYPESSRRCY